jgi:hypothetical protein
LAGAFLIGAIKAQKISLVSAKDKLKVNMKLQTFDYTYKLEYNL